MGQGSRLSRHRTRAQPLLTMPRPKMRKRRPSFSGGSVTSSFCLPRADHEYIRELALMRGVSNTLVLMEAVQLYREAQTQALNEVYADEKKAKLAAAKNARGMAEEVEL